MPRHPPCALHNLIAIIHRTQKGTKTIASYLPCFPARRSNYFFEYILRSITLFELFSNICILKILSSVKIIVQMPLLLYLIVKYRSWFSGLSALITCRPLQASCDVSHKSHHSNPWFFFNKGVSWKIFIFYFSQSHFNFNKLLTAVWPLVRKTFESFDRNRSR